MVEHRHLDYSENSVPEVESLEWARAYRWLVFSINQTESLLPVGGELNFEDFMDCVLFLLETVGLKKINSPYDMFFHLRDLANKGVADGHLNYPADIFAKPFDYAGNQSSQAAAYFIQHPLTVIENSQFILRLGRLDSQQPWGPWAGFYGHLAIFTLPKLRLAENAKYLPCILGTAKELVEILKLRVH